jgi:hypothetical protein
MEVFSPDRAKERVTPVRRSTKAKAQGWNNRFDWLFLLDGENSSHGGFPRAMGGMAGG